MESITLPKVFSPSYEPSKLLHRECDSRLYNKQIRDTIQDKNSHPLIVKGVDGEGRRVFQKINTTIYFNTSKYKPLYFDGRESTTSKSLMFLLDFIESRKLLRPSLLKSCHYTDYLIKNRNNLKLYIIVVNDCEKLDLGLLRRIRKNCSLKKIHFFGTCNEKLRRKCLEFFNFCQDPIYLSRFTLNQLEDIGNYYTDKAEFNQISKGYIKLMSAICIKNNVYTPEKIIQIIKETYTQFRNQGNLSYNASQIISKCFNNLTFDGYSLKELYNNATDIFKRFLRILTEEFGNIYLNFRYNKFCLTSEELREIYAQSCNFYNQLWDYDKLDLFLKSMEKDHFLYSKNKIINKRPYLDDKIFFTLDLYKFKEIINEIEKFNGRNYYDFQNLYS